MLLNSEAIRSSVWALWSEFMIFLQSLSQADIATFWAPMKDMNSPSLVITMMP